MPPSLPAMNRPGTFDSNSGVTAGMSMPRFSVPNTSVIASTGHAAAQAPWPMQAAALTSTAVPSTMPKACSGHALTQELDARQRAASTTGCNDGVSPSPASNDCCS